MTGDYTSQHTDLRLPSSGSRKPDWRSRAAPTPRELTAALARLKQRCPEGLPAEIEALLENREIAFVQVAMPPAGAGRVACWSRGTPPFFALSTATFRPGGGGAEAPARAERVYGEPSPPTGRKSKRPSWGF